MTTDRSPKPCLHLRARHQHGTALAYSKDGCHCPACVTAHRRADKATRYRTATGTHGYVPADRARAHVERLLATLTVNQIEQRSGVNRTSVRVLIGAFPGRPASRRITRTTERALLTVRGDRVGAEQHGLVDGTGTRRRLRALAALGWPVEHLRRRLGFSSRTTWTLTRPDIDDAEPVRASTRAAVRRLYDELSLTTPAPSRAASRARNLAAARGWPSPRAWDDDTIDDPQTQPFADDDQAVDDHADDVDEFVIELVLDGQPMNLTGRDLEVAALRLAEAGHDYAAIAARCRSDETTVRRVLNTARQRIGRTAARTSQEAAA